MLFRARGRLLALSIAGAYIVASLLFSRSPEEFRRLISPGIALLPGLILIWLSDPIGAYTGPTRTHSTTNPSTGCAVALLGWILFLMPMLTMLVRFFK